MSRHLARAALLGALLLTVACATSARRQHAGGEEAHDWRAEPHHLSLFLGGTFEEEDGYILA